jgi:hypothetical protein
MCVAAPVLFATSMALTAYSGYRQAQAQREAGNAQNNYYDALAQTSQMEGQYALKMGQKQSELIQDQAKMQGKELAQSQAQLSSSQKARMAAMGMDPSSVTAGDIVSSTYDSQKLDELMLRYNADMKSWNTMTQASYDKWRSDAQAEQYLYAGDYAKRAGRINARNTLLGTAVSMAGSALTYGVGSGFSSSTQGLSGWLKGYKNAPNGAIDTGYGWTFKPLSN